MTHFGLPPPSLLDVRNAIGGGIEQAIAKLFGPQHAALVVEATAYYRSCFPQHLLVGLKLMPGALELIRALNAQVQERHAADPCFVFDLYRVVAQADDQIGFADHFINIIGVGIKRFH